MSARFTPIFSTIISWGTVSYMLLAMTLAGPGSALAGRFVNITETATFPRGEGEVVQATAFSKCRDQACANEALEFQVGVEYGLLDRLQVGFSLPQVATVWAEGTKSTAVGGTLVWGLYNFIDTESRGWGLSGVIIYAEGQEERGADLALLAEKPLGNWIVVYNAVGGRTWAGVDDFGRADAMSHSLGASYQVSGSLFLGVEGDWFLEDTPDTSWTTAGRFVGPNLSVTAGPLWVTAAAHFSVGSPEVSPDRIFQAQVGLPF